MAFWAFLTFFQVNILRQSRRLYGCGPLKGAFSQPAMVQESAAAQTRAMRAQTAKNILPECQTLTATPAEPGVLPGAIAGRWHGRSHCVMAGFISAIHDFAAISTASRGWPAQACPWAGRRPGPRGRP